MIRNLASTVCFATALLLVTGACKSAHESAPAAQSSAQSAAALPDDGRPKTDLLASIAAAKASAPGARFLGAEFGTDEGRSIYSVVLVGDGVVHEISIDPVDGKILEAGEEKLDEEGQKFIDEMLGEHASVAVEQAISAALEKLPGSWARAAGLAHDGQRTCYGVLVMSGGATKQVLVSAQDGKVQEVRDAPTEEDDEGGEAMEDSTSGHEMKEQEKQPEPAPVPPK
jgi:uncharacterized membrane protein YkoI